MGMKTTFLRVLLIFTLCILFAYPAYAWDKSSTDIDNNGNLDIAKRMVESDVGRTLWKKATPITGDMLVRNKFSNLGKMLKITGIVEYISEVDSAYTLILLIPASPHYDIPCFHYGYVPTHIREGSEITFYGYYVGIRKINGIDGMWIVGNKVELLRR